MAKVVVNGATLRCDKGTAPSTLTVLPVNGTGAEDQPAATVQDMIPMTNIKPFGMCTTTANPQVAAATAAAQGTLTPQPCIPVITGPWSPGSAVATIQGMKVLVDNCTCKCSWTGTISIQNAGATVAETDD